MFAVASLYYRAQTHRHHPRAASVHFSTGDINSRRSTMLLRLVPVALVIVVTSIGFSDTHLVEVPESSYPRYMHLAVRLTRLKSLSRRPALYLLGLRKVVWPNNNGDRVVITIEVTDSTCQSWPVNSWNCKPQVNSPLYTCIGLAQVKKGLKLVKFWRSKCWRSVCRK
nr:uncharacterized protein LOC119167936 [Rhipicephalus microplus]